MQTYKSLTPFVATNLLSRLITKKIWTSPQLWEGFIRVSKILGPASYGALLQLPREQLKEIVTREDGKAAKAGLREFVVKKVRLLPLTSSACELPSTDSTMFICDFRPAAQQLVSQRGSPRSSGIKPSLSLLLDRLRLRRGHPHSALPRPQSEEPTRQRAVGHSRRSRQVEVRRRLFLEEEEWRRPERRRRMRTRWTWRLDLAWSYVRGWMDQSVHKMDTSHFCILSELSLCFSSPSPSSGARTLSCLSRTFSASDRLSLLPDEREST